MTTWSEQLRAEGRTEGLAEGRAEGKVGLLVSMARQRFGEAVASTMSALLGSVRTESALEEVGTWLLTCETGDALIAKIRQIELGLAPSAGHGKRQSRDPAPWQFGNVKVFSLASAGADAPGIPSRL